MDFNLKEAVSKRYSMRTFNSKKVDDATRQKILDYAEKISNPFGPKSELRLLKSRLVQKAKSLELTV